MADKKCKAVYFPIPNVPQVKGDSTVPNKLKVEVYHDDGGASLSGTRIRGIKVRFGEVERYDDSPFETLLLFNPKHSLAFPLIPLNRVNPKKLAKVDEIIKANIDKLVEMWFANLRQELHALLADLVKGV